MGWLGMLWTLVILQSTSATLLYIGQRVHALLTILRLSDNKLYCGCTVYQGKSNLYCTKPLNSSLPSAPLYTNMPSEVRSLGSTLTYSSLEMHITDPLGCAPGQKAMKPEGLSTGVRVKRLQPLKMEQNGITSQTA